jgi:uncharacterized membrane protein HdeD (DUF308 family)
MKIFYLAYCIFLLLFGAFFMLIAMASSHHLDKSYFFVLIFSTVSFLATVIILFKNFVSAKQLNIGLCRFFVFCNTLAFIYYSYDLLYKSDELELINYSPLVGVLSSILVFLFLNKSNKAT